MFRLNGPWTWTSGAAAAGITGGLWIGDSLTIEVSGLSDDGSISPLAGLSYIFALVVIGLLL